MRGRAERWLGIGDPALFAQRPDRFGKAPVIVEWRQVAEEVQLASGMGGLQPFDEEPAEQLGEDMDRQEEAGLARYPARTVGSEYTAGNEAMDMGMMGQRMPPGVQDTDEAEFAARRCLGSAAMVLSVAATASKRMP
ncbi:hypothetical protein SAMN05518801_1313 [Novosphingobium sp. CF614]|nr:hypothetical protein SAMN05518801_1313 [Novosphingobium sp. CF614]